MASHLVIIINTNRSDQCAESSVRWAVKIQSHKLKWEWIIHVTVHMSVMDSECSHLSPTSTQGKLLWMLWWLPLQHVDTSIYLSLSPCSVTPELFFSWALFCEVCFVVINQASMLQKANIRKVVGKVEAHGSSSHLFSCNHSFCDYHSFSTVSFNCISFFKSVFLVL